MNLHEISGLLAGVIFALSASWYVLDVARHKVVPSFASFLIFTLINISQLASLVVEQVWAVLPFTIVGTLASIAVCTFAIKRQKFYLELPDKLGFVGALLGCLLWFGTKDAALNLYVLNAVNLIAFVPLIIKSFKRPDLESLLPWQLNLVASFFLLLTINSTAAVVWIVPARQFACSILLNLGLYFGNN